MEARGRELKQHLPPARFGGELLVSLPLDVLELVCSSLTLKDRVALTFCCRRLWTRPDVTKSRRLWDVIEAYATHSSVVNRPVSLGHWLARRKAAVGRLIVRGYMDGTNPAALLAGLEDGALASWELHEMDAIGTNPAGALAPLAHLGGLTELKLQYCKVRRLPPQLSALTALKVLDIADRMEPDGAQAAAAFAPLAALTQLTALRLQHCGLCKLPRQLSALSASLQFLDLASNWDLGDWVAGSMRPLNSLSALTSLDMTRCGLPCIPPQLSAMGSLQQLQLFGNDMTGARPKSWEPLRRLTCLTLLDLAECHIGYLPQQLACLTALAELILSYNSAMGDFLYLGGPEGDEESSWQPLLSLGASLTCLRLSGCNIPELRAGFSGLSALVKLDLSRNVELGFDADTAFQPLSGLVGLKVLKMYSMQLKCIPPQLKMLPALADLRLWNNRSLGEQGAALGQQLMELSALERLDLGGGIYCDPSTKEVVKLLRGRGVDV
ncbi:hypothetical protein N2152v2_009982 [Parachlorella kessleri]